VFVLALSATAAAMSGSVAKKTLAAIAARTAAINGSVSKKAELALVAVSTALKGSVTKAGLLVLTAKVSALNGLVAKKTSTVLSALSSAVNDSVAKKALLAVVARTAAQSGLLVKKSEVVMAGVSCAFSATVAHIEVIVLALSATMASFNGFIAKKTFASLFASATSLSGQVAKQTRTSLLAASASLSAAVMESEGGGTIHHYALSALSNTFSAILSWLHISSYIGTIGNTIVGPYQGASLAAAFTNPEGLDIFQVMNDGSACIYKLTSDGVGVNNPASWTKNALLARYQGNTISAAFSNPNNLDLLQIVSRGGKMVLVVDYTGASRTM